MESRGYRVGDVIRLSTDPSPDHARPFRIDGVYEPTPDPLRFAHQRLEVRFHLPDLQSLIAGAPRQAQNGMRASREIEAESVTSINVALKDPRDAAAFANDVAGRVPGVVARPIDAPTERTTTFAVIERFHLAIAIVTVVGSAVFLLALMVMLVDERRSTVGILRLIGFTRGRIVLQLFAEGVVIALAGAAVGILFALASEDLFNRFFQWRYDTTLVFLRITPEVASRSLLIAVPLGIAASLAASWSVLRQHLLALLRR
jgi:putative ABC transport system permease protein